MPHAVRIHALRGADILVRYASFAMQAYLTKVWGLGFTHAAGILNIWEGIVRILQVLFSFLADQFLGNFKMLALSSIAYSTGLGLLTMSTLPILDNYTGKCNRSCAGHTQQVLFFTGMALIAMGRTGHLVSVDPFLEEQKDKNDGCCGSQLLKKLGFASVVIISLVGAFALLSIKQWYLRFGIPTICTAIATLLFFSAWGKYNKDPPQGSPLTNICRVLVASCYRKPQQDVYELDRKDERLESQSFSRTRFLGCLEKAAIKPPDVSTGRNRWRVCSVEEVEEAKTVVRMVPMWMTFIVCGMVSSIGNTYFVEQAESMNRRIGTWKVPLPVLQLFYELAKYLLGRLADFLLEKTRKGAPPGGTARPVETAPPGGTAPQEGTPEAEIKQRKYAPPVGIAVGMIFSILCSITAAKMETQRRNEISGEGEKSSMSTFWLVLPFILLAGLDSFFKKSVAAFYEDEAPESIRNYLGYFSEGMSGVGFVCNVLLVFVVANVSATEVSRSSIVVRKDWFEGSLDKSRLDRYYWVLSVLSSVNLVAFIVVASCFTYKDPKEEGHEAGGDPRRTSDRGSPAKEGGPRLLGTCGLDDWSACLPS